MEGRSLLGLQTLGYIYVCMNTQVIGHGYRDLSQYDSGNLCKRDGFVSSSI